MVLIFSKNRVMQLELLLFSMSKYFPELDDITVLYVDEFGSYPLLDYDVTMCEQTDFRLDTLELIELSETIMFLCDDDVFFQNTIIPDLGEFETFSLRLGNNITNKKQFQYTISLDGNIFNTDDIYPYMEQCRFDNPNELEKALVPYQKFFSMKWHRQCLVGVPHNRVSDGSKCWYSGEYSVEELDDAFRQGYRIRNLQIDNLTDVHAPITYNLVQTLEKASRRFDDRVTW